VRGALLHVDRVASGDVALAQNPQVCAWPAGSRKALEKLGVVHPQAKLETGQPRLADLEQRRADSPLLADHRLRDGEASNREILPEGAWIERAFELGLPPFGVLDRVRVDSLVRSAVDCPVGLIVTAQINAAQRDSALDRVFPDRRQDGVAVRVDRTRHADVHRLDRAGIGGRGAGHFSSGSQGTGIGICRAESEREPRGDVNQ